MDRGKLRLLADAFIVNPLLVYKEVRKKFFPDDNR